MTVNPEIHISVTVLATVIVFLVLLLVFSFWFVRRTRAVRGSFRTGDPDWSVPTIDAYADRSSFFHQWDPRIKIVSLFLYCFMVVSLHSLCWSAVAFAIALPAVAACNIPFTRAGKRLTAMAGFLSMFLLIVPFTSPLRSSETLIYLPGLMSFPFHSSGFFLALTIVFKACAIALMMEPLLGTAPLAVTLQSLSYLGIPDSVGQMVLLSHRYIFVFLHEITRMYRGMRVRGFVPGTNIATMSAMGNFFGMLFVRSFDRTQRVYDAMLCRGYSGQFPSFVRFQTTAKDWAKGGLWIMMGLVLLAVDRIYGNLFF